MQGGDGSLRLINQLWRHATTVARCGDGRALPTQSAQEHDSEVI